LADRIIVTDEESYSEEPSGIRKAILEGITEAKADVKTTEIADRRQAIEKALSLAKRGDTLLITGMGHEQFRIVDGKKIPWNDATVVKELIAQKSSSS
jgi:UDP-N-acetylmuramoyl-L-alanyl-D-glutamate--2,6-diaminopimelate ligase